MILGISELHRLVREGKLVENLSDRELNNPEGAGFDLRIGEIYRIAGEGFLGIEERETPPLELLATYDSALRTVFNLEPNTYYVMKTIERVNTPLDTVILFRPRSTLYRSGVTVFTGNCAPGYNGELNFGIINLGKKPFRLEMGARVAHALFFKVLGDTASYRGQWQGGRATTDGKEKQV